MSLRRTIAAASALLAASLVIAGTATAQNTTRSSDTNSCPSKDTVMTSNWYGATKGYLCSQEYHSGNRNIGAGTSQSFSTSTHIDYFPQYYCWDSSDDKVTTYSHAEIFGSGSVTAHNGGTGSHTWGAGYLYTLGSGSVTGWENGCNTSSSVWKNAPNLLQITNITARNLPDNGVSKAGVVSYSVSASVTPSSYAVGQQVALQDNGTSVAGSKFDANGNATITWTPAEMGTHKIVVAWPGAGGVLGNMTDDYTINVSGGVGTKIQYPIVDNGNGSATATVNVETTPDTFPSGTSVTLMNAATKTAIAPSVALTTSGTTASAKVPFTYTGRTQYKLYAVVSNAAGNPMGGSYTMPFQGGTVVKATMPTTAYLSSTTAGCQPVNIPVAIEPSTATGSVAATGGDNVTLSGGAASARWCPPTTAGTSNVAVSYSGDSATPAGTSATSQIAVSGAAPYTLKVNGVSWSTFTYVQGKGYVYTDTTASISTTGIPNGATVKLTNGGTSVLGSGTVSNGSASVIFTAPETSTKFNMIATYTPASSAQSFNSPVYATTSPCYNYCTKERSVDVAPAAAAERGATVKRADQPKRAEQPKRATSAQETAKRTAPGRRGNPGASGPGDIAAVSTGTLSVSRSAKVTSSRRSLTANCPKGYYPLNTQGSTNGPDTDFTVSVEGRRATITSPPENVGKRMFADVLCRQGSAKAMLTGALGYGTRGPDRLRTTMANGTVFAGPGPDRIAAIGNNSSAWGGQGRDRIVIGGRDSGAAGGPGADRIVAVGSGRKLVWGGIGRDTLVGGTGNTLLNAVDGRGGDRVICRSPANRVMLDPGDVTSGPCKVVSAD